MPEQLRTTGTATSGFPNRAVEGVIHENAVYAGVDSDPAAAADRAAPLTPDSAMTNSETVAAPDDSGFATYSVGEASSRGGEIVVTATDSGLPLTVCVAPGQLRRDPGDLGDDILRLCRLAADRAGLARRAYLSDLGLSEQTLTRLGLPTQAAVETAELADEAEHEYEPRSWLDRDGDTW